MQQAADILIWVPVSHPVLCKLSVTDNHKLGGRVMDVFKPVGLLFFYYVSTCVNFTDCNFQWIF